jgi:hypothetical protein
VIQNRARCARGEPDPSPTEAIVNAHRFNEKLLRGGAPVSCRSAKSKKLHLSCSSQVLRGAYHPSLSGDGH